MAWSKTQTRRMSWNLLLYRLDLPTLQGAVHLMLLQDRKQHQNALLLHLQTAPLLVVVGASPWGVQQHLRFHQWMRKSP